MIRALLLASLFLAQEDPVIRSSVVNVQVPVSVVDKKGNFIHGLTVEDFKLFDAGALQKIEVDEAAYPISLAVAVQANTNARDVLLTVRKASALLAPLVAGDTGEICVIGFDHRVEVLTPFSSDPAVIKSSFSQLKPGGGPHHLNDAAMEGIKLLNTRGRDRKKILLLIGEGFDKGSELSPSDVLMAAESNGILIYGLKMKPTAPQSTIAPANKVPAENRPPLPMGAIRTGTMDVQTGGHAPTLNDIYGYFNGLRADSDINAYAQFTGGRDHSFSNQRNLEQAIEKIGKEVHSQYLLTFAPQQKEFGYHPITVQVRAANLEVRARSGYWSAP